MKPSTRPPSAALRIPAVVVGAVGLALLAGCSNGTGTSPGSGSTSTVTVTSSPPATPTSSATPTATTDVKGRGYDVGTVSDVNTVAGVQTLELDRWTVDGLSDTKLSREGVTIEPHADQRYRNQNSSKTYTVVVAPGATAVVNRCVRSGAQLGLESTPTDAEAWLDKVAETQVLVLTYDDKGRVTRFDTDPRCSS